MQNYEDGSFSLVLTNPPFHAGKSVDYGITQALIRESQRVLSTGGRIVMVANRFIRYDYELKKYFTNVCILASNGRYQLITAIKGS